MAILQQLNAANGKPVTQEELLAVIAKLQQENAALTVKRAVRYKVSEKGAISVYGLNVRFPVTLYAGQWERLLDQSDKLRAFIKDNAASLSRKE